MPVFRALDFVSRLPIPQSQDANCRKSPAMSPIIPVLGRLWAETGGDHDCRLHVASMVLPSLVWEGRYWGPIAFTAARARHTISRYPAPTR
jgi:hypothetical protein